jgi:hypothetical protein
LDIEIFDPDPPLAKHTKDAKGLECREDTDPVNHGPSLAAQSRLQPIARIISFINIPHRPMELPG